ncbi:hydrogen gas-evolving membrane-bound hydrogenase subunit E [Brachybacterium sp.]|uniref:hydrogen gas-evolving membrane-bound hydrogenase subunit E n=1 Tax=Brachybacterium sp. TaxID=1891286 RepID=UPI002ED425A5
MSLLLAVVSAWVLVPLAPFAVRVCGRHAGWPLAAGMLFPLLVLVSLRATAGDVSEAVPWIPALDVAVRLRMDGLAFLFVLLILVIGAVVLVYSSSYLRSPRSPGFYLLMTAFAAAMLTLVLADDLLLLYVAWELTTLCSYLLILRSGPHAGAAATRTLLVTVAGGLCLLGAVVLIAVRTGTLHLSEALSDPAWSTDPGFATAAAVLVAVAAMTKSAQFPFHSWLPDAMVAPAPVSAYLHAAAMVKAGIYLLMLFSAAASNASIWPIGLIAVGLFTAALGAVLATTRSDLKSLLAYSTVSQLGLLVAVIGVGTSTALLAASIHVVAHALFKSSLFMAVGLVEKRTGTRNVHELSGLWRVLRWDSLMIVLAAASMAGIIPLLGFVSKELIFESLLHSPWGTGVGWLLAVLATAATVFTVAYCARLVLPTLPGPAMDGVKPWGYAAAMSGTVSITALAGLILGLGVGVLDPVVVPAAADSAGAPAGDVGHLALWHGLNIPLVLSILAILGGLSVAVALGRRDASRGAREEWRSPVTGVGVVQGIHDGIITFGRRVGDLTRHDSTAGQLAVPLVIIGAASLATPLLWRGFGDHSSSTMYDAILLVVMVCGTLAVVRARTRLGGLIASGVVGFAVVLSYFVLGASDVALTQLLVEVLTVVVMVLVLRRMSWRFPKENARRRAAAAVAAVFAGAAATAAALVFTGHRDLSEIGAYMLAEAEELTGGTNVVNVILVDFRALDTFGELVVLAIGAISVAALLDARPLVDRPTPAPASRALADPFGNADYLRILGRVLVPVLIAVSALALLRGHTQPGGGFIAALLAACAVVLSYLSAPTDDVPRIQRPYLAIAGLGMIVAGVTGFLGLADGSFLRALHADVLGYHFTTALVFDLGVYFAVLGVVLAAINRLGSSTPDDGTGRPPGGARTQSTRAKRGERSERAIRTLEGGDGR